MQSGEYEENYIETLAKLEEEFKNISNKNQLKQYIEKIDTEKQSIIDYAHDTFYDETENNENSMNTVNKIKLDDDQLGTVDAYDRMKTIIKSNSKLTNKKLSASESRKVMDRDLDDLYNEEEEDK